MGTNIINGIEISTSNIFQASDRVEATNSFVKPSTFSDGVTRNLVAVTQHAKSITIDYTTGNYRWYRIAKAPIAGGRVGGLVSFQVTGGLSAPLAFQVFASCSWGSLIGSVLGSLAVIGGGQNNVVYAFRLIAADEEGDGYHTDSYLDVCLNSASSGGVNALISSVIINADSYNWVVGTPITSAASVGYTLGQGVAAISRIMGVTVTTTNPTSSNVWVAGVGGTSPTTDFTS